MYLAYLSSDIWQNIHKCRIILKLFPGFGVCVLACSVVIIHQTAKNSHLNLLLLSRVKVNCLLNSIDFEAWATAWNFLPKSFCNYNREQAQRRLIPSFDLVGRFFFGDRNLWMPDMLKPSSFHGMPKLLHTQNIRTFFPHPAASSFSSHFLLVAAFARRRWWWWSERVSRSNSNIAT